MYVPKELMTSQQFMDECKKADAKAYMDLAPIRDKFVDSINTALMDWARDNPSMNRKQELPYVLVSLPYASKIEKLVYKNVMNELKSKGFGVDHDGIPGEFKNMRIFPFMDPL